MKKTISILFILLPLLAFAQYQVPEYVQNYDSDDVTVYSTDIGGGCQEVADSAARADIPVAKRAMGMIVSYDSSGVWLTERFEGSSTLDAQWLNESNWVRIITDVEDDLNVKKSDSTEVFVTPHQLNDTIDLLVKKSDSLTRFVTPLQLIDSLNSFTVPNADTANNLSSGATATDSIIFPGISDWYIGNLGATFRIYTTGNTPHLTYGNNDIYLTSNQTTFNNNNNAVWFVVNTDNVPNAFTIDGDNDSIIINVPTNIDDELIFRDTSVTYMMKDTLVNTNYVRSTITNTVTGGNGVDVTAGTVSLGDLTENTTIDGSYSLKVGDNSEMDTIRYNAAFSDADDDLSVKMEIFGGDDAATGSNPDYEPYFYVEPKEYGSVGNILKVTATDFTLGNLTGKRITTDGGCLNLYHGDNRTLMCTGQTSFNHDQNNVDVDFFKNSSGYWLSYDAGQDTVWADGRWRFGGDFLADSGRMGMKVDTFYYAASTTSSSTETPRANVSFIQAQSVMTGGSSITVTLNIDLDNLETGAPHVVYIHAICDKQVSNVGGSEVNIRNSSNTVIATTNNDVNNSTKDFIIQLIYNPYYSNKWLLISNNEQ